MAEMSVRYKAYSFQRSVEFRVILPVEDTKTYRPHPEDKPERFKTLYLLHGYSGDCNDWIYGSRIFKIARDHNLAVVMPSAENSFYEDNEETGARYGSFVGEELVEVTRRMFPLSDRREDTFIGGLSMGGFGSLLLGSRFCDTFSAAVCLSSGFILEDLAAGRAMHLEKAGELSRMGGLFGDLSHIMDPSDKNPMYHVDRALAQGRMPRLYLACGTEDFVYPSNVRTRDELLAKGAEVTWEEGPGEHEWTFWDKYIERAVDWLLTGSPEGNTAGGKESHAR